MLLWLIEESAWRSYYSDSQSFTLSLSNMKSLELTALYTLPYSLPRHAKSSHGIHDGHVVGRCMVHKQIP